ncbi:GAF domain-containing protein [Marinitoga lauensis]|uniref:GAF domain-containing protein n=1 Tax=Marinitoga lauensis TaxID=2201189 RepID=UPI00101385CC|nr:GAF domain-containing protein [Marinitoga lauensis]
MVIIKDENIISFFSTLLKTFGKKTFKDFYDMQCIFEPLLSKILSLNPILTSGSIILRDIDGYFKYIAVKGHDMSILKEIKFSKDNISEESFHGIRLIKSKMLKESKEQIELLVKGGNLLKLKSYLSIPIYVNNNTIGFLNLDNYSEKNIFTNNIISMAKVFADFMGILYHNILIKRELCIRNEMLKKAEIINNNNLYTKNFILKKAEEFFENYEEFVFLIIKLKSQMDRKSLKCIIRRVNSLFEDDFVAFENNTFFVLSEYISDYFLKNEVTNKLKEPLYWNSLIIPDFEYYFYNIPEDLKNIKELKETMEV